MFYHKGVEVQKAREVHNLQAGRQEYVQCQGAYKQRSQQICRYNKRLGTTKSLQLYFEEIDKIHPNIKFTMKKHTTSRGETDNDRCSCQTEESIPFFHTFENFKHLQRTQLKALGLSG